ncbi:hypothetical protein Mapa_004084 [Marchantia paleacea]|nr:hypothetical protein Mapa_004084 [Marchantia paleacea]
MASTSVIAVSSPCISIVIETCAKRIGNQSRRLSCNLCPGNGIGSLRTTFRPENCGSSWNRTMSKQTRLSAHSRNGERAIVRSHAVSGIESTQGVDKVDGSDTVHQFVIVGAGIAGLATAVAMDKIGVKSLLLEQSAELRTTGSSLSLWSNAWRVLDLLGIGDELRSKHTATTGLRFSNQEGKLLKSFEIDECPGGPHVVCCVERKLLANSLASRLPRGTIRYNSRVLSIKRESETGPFELKLSDGSVLRTKVLLGADGVNSVVAQWMGLAKPRYVGQVGNRGLAVYPAGQPYGDKGRQFIGRGVRAGWVPISATKVYWFVVHARANLGPKVTDPNEVKAELLRMLDGWPVHMKDLINQTPLESISRAALVDRWNLPGITAPVVQNGITLAGDALHPMTPNLGQGGCTSLEDAIKLTQTVGVVLAKGDNADCESVTKAMKEYAAERHQRAFPLTVQSFIFGIFLIISFPPFCFVREHFLIPRMVGPKSVLAHTFYDCGELPKAQVVKK